MKFFTNVLFAVALTACGADDQKITTAEDSEAHSVVSYNASLDECSELSREDEELEEYLHLFRESYESSGANDLPIEVLERLTVLKKVPYGELNPDGKKRNGQNERVHCTSGPAVWQIRIADPETAPEGSPLQNKLLFIETVLHEIGHVFYGHYDGDENTVTTKAGLMAANKNIRKTSVEDHENRISQLFRDEDYKARLPKKFHVNEFAENVSEQGEIDSSMTSE